MICGNLATGSVVGGQSCSMEPLSSISPRVSSSPNADIIEENWTLVVVLLHFFFCFTSHEWKSILHASPTPSQFCPSFCSSASSSAVAKALFSLVGDGDCLGWALLPPRGWDSLFWAKVCFRHFKATRALAVACTHFLLLWTPRYELPLGGTEFLDWNLFWIMND